MPRAIPGSPSGVALVYQSDEAGRESDYFSDSPSRSSLKPPPSPRSLHSDDNNALEAALALLNVYAAKDPLADPASSPVLTRRSSNKQLQASSSSLQSTSQSRSPSAHSLPNPLSEEPACIENSLGLDIPSELHASTSRRISSHSSLAALIKEKRRQASITCADPTSPAFSASQGPSLVNRRQRSRAGTGRSTRLSFSALSSPIINSANSETLSSVSADFPGFASMYNDARMRGIDEGLSDVVLTPTTQEWRALGLGDSSPRKPRSRRQSARSNTQRSQPTSPTLSRKSSMLMMSQSSDSESSTTSDEEMMDTSLVIKDKEVASPATPQRPQHLPLLSRQSISLSVGKPLSSVFGANSDPSTPKSPSPKPPTTAIPLEDVDSYIEASSYSIMTHARSIDSFVLEGDAGKGAYGLVRKARLKGPDGQPVGPQVMVKYIVKSRILADAWKKHRTLGPIPVEVHILDHIRRIARPSADAQDQTGHPNVCGMLDFFDDEEHYYMVMPMFGVGRDLFDYIDAYPSGLSLAESKSILSQVVSAVSWLHNLGIVHRDIKDENVILDGNGNVQLIDFGSAAYVKESKPWFDTFSGTLDFASPEVLRGERYNAKETDVWALGILAYVVLCGECPFWKSEEALQGITIHSRAYRALRAKCTGSKENHPNGEPEALHAADFVERCLEVQSRDRPPAGQLLRHAFMTDGGWNGRRGWESTA